ncbi:hypothetical protein [Pseudoroseicyclus sp. CXY001]|uniref:hypothetical protein n=1 Tax=Pseudoroseicyclus sp. CXY001 TaxID=3242492 RepID=UPI003570CDB1
MDLSAEAEIAAPAPWVFDQLADFARFEQLARERGTRVERMAEAGAPVGPGTSWDIHVTFRGHERHLKPRVTRWSPPEGYQLTSASQGLVLTVDVALTPKGERSTGLRLSVSAEGKSLKTKVFLTSLSLGQGRMTARLQERVNGYAETLSQRYPGAGA